MEIRKNKMGQIQGVTVYNYTLFNNNGMAISIMNYGATINSIKIPDKTGNTTEICCGFDTLEGYFTEAYRTNAPYFGGTVGRYCSQIKDARFTLKGKEYILNRNCGENNLHGGKSGFDKKIWEVSTFEDEDSVRLECSFLSEDMEEGFPGNVAVRATFLLNNDNELRIDYWALSDKDTPFTITNHSYFNLSGFTRSIENHSVQIASDKKQVWDSTGAATGEIISVAASFDDLRHPKIIKEVQEAMKDGFEHYYLFDEKGLELGSVAKITDNSSGRSLEVATTEPGMLFYTGKYTSDDLRRESGQQYGKFMGFCCETHRYPNGPNILSAQSILSAGEDFNSTTVFKFKW